MNVFRRGDFNQIWITLRSDEVLGILDSGYVEDYYGNQGQITLHHLESGIRVPILLNELIGQDDPTPSLPHDVFSGYLELSGLQDGSYKIEGKVRDTVGNYTILSTCQEYSQNDRIVQFDLRITDEQIVVEFPQAAISLGMLFSTPLPSINFLLTANIVKNTTVSSKINNVSILPVSVVKYCEVDCKLLKNYDFITNIGKNIELEAGIGYGS